jgi:uncharacterized membrane protein
VIETAAPTCSLCGKRTATYVCQDCGRAVCSNCFDPAHWSCADCQARLRPMPAQQYSAFSPFSLTTWLFFIAFAIIVVGALLMTLGSIQNLSGSSGAVILIGPIPIVLGAGPYSYALIGLAVALTVLALIFFVALRRKL